MSRSEKWGTDSQGKKGIELQERGRRDAQDGMGSEGGGTEERKRGRGRERDRERGKEGENL